MNADAELTITRADDPGDGAAVVNVSGELVITSLGMLTEQVELMLADDRPTIILNCSELAHVDTPGFALLHQLSKRCQGAGGTLFVAGLAPHFIDLAHKLRVDLSVSLVESSQAARNQLET